MAYRRQYAIDRPWNETINTAEDGPFMEAAAQNNRIANLDGRERFVATTHEGNLKRYWQPVATEKLPEGFNVAAGI